MQLEEFGHGAIAILGFGGEGEVAVMVFMALRSLEFCIGLFSGFAFAVEVPIGCEDLQGLQVW